MHLQSVDYRQYYIGTTVTYLSLPCGRKIPGSCLLGVLQLLKAGGGGRDCLPANLLITDIYLSVLLSDLSG